MNLKTTLPLFAAVLLLAGCDKETTLHSYLLDPSLEEKIRKSVRQTSGGSYLAMDPATVRAILAVVKRTIGDLNKIPQKPVIIVSVDIRRYFLSQVAARISPRPRHRWRRRSWDGYSRISSAYRFCRR